MISLVVAELWVRFRFTWTLSLSIFSKNIVILTTRWVTLPPVGVLRCVWEGWRESLRTEVEST